MFNKKFSLICDFMFFSPIEGRLKSYKFENEGKKKSTSDWGMGD